MWLWFEWLGDLSGFDFLLLVSGIVMQVVPCFIPSEPDVPGELDFIHNVIEWFKWLKWFKWLWPFILFFRSRKALQPKWFRWFSDFHLFCFFKFKCKEENKIKLSQLKQTWFYASDLVDSGDWSDFWLFSTVSNSETQCDQVIQVIEVILTFYDFFKSRKIL